MQLALFHLEHFMLAPISGHASSHGFLEALSGYVNWRNQACQETPATSWPMQLGHVRFRTQEEFFAQFAAWAKAKGPKVYHVIRVSIDGHPGGLGYNVPTNETKEPEPTLAWAVSIREIAEAFADQLRRKMVMFSSCSTLTYPEAALDFMQTTGLQHMFGFTKDVDWVEANVVDTLLLSYLRFGCKRLWDTACVVRAMRAFATDHSSLWERTGAVFWYWNRQRPVSMSV